MAKISLKLTQFDLTLTGWAEPSVKFARINLTSANHAALTALNPWARAHTDDGQAGADARPLAEGDLVHGKQFVEARRNGGHAPRVRARRVESMGKCHAGSQTTV
jgi:hypothetical protein